jgi:Phosphotransferase enzyme family
MKREYRVTAALAGYRARQVRRWHDQWLRVATRELPDLDRLYDGLAGQVPTTCGAAIVHGVVRIDNAILTSDLSDVGALVDWEMATARHRDGSTVGQRFGTVGSAGPGLAALGLCLLAGGEIVTQMLAPPKSRSERA